jgi:hypothetical protein
VYTHQQTINSALPLTIATVSIVLFKATGVHQEAVLQNVHGPVMGIDDS